MALTPPVAFDALFLHRQTPATPAHVGALNLLDPPDGPTEPFDAISSHMTARFSASPVLP